jgi:hypothetical protein
MRFVKDGGSTERLGSQIPSTAVLELRNGEMCVFVDDDDDDDEEEEEYEHPEDYLEDSCDTGRPNPEEISPNIIEIIEDVRVMPNICWLSINRPSLFSRKRQRWISCVKLSSKFRLIISMPISSAFLVKSSKTQVNLSSLPFNC